ncbi:MAG: hypothetical protein IH865_09685 [Chloroflexi bacterium]|nr:hypothetical protein [Chloroflexota bacterium]
MTTQQVDPLRECKEAKETLEAATRSLNSQGELLIRLGRGLLGDPIGVKLANSGLFRPIDLPDDCLIDYGAIPSREDVKEGLGDYDAARAGFEAALRKLPPDEQELFVRGSTRREAPVTF